VTVHVAVPPIVAGCAMRNDHRPTVLRRLQKREQYYEKAMESLFWKFQFADPEAAIPIVSRTLHSQVHKVYLQASSRRFTGCHPVLWKRIFAIW